MVLLVDPLACFMMKTVSLLWQHSSGYPASNGWASSFGTVSPFIGFAPEFFAEYQRGLASRLMKDHLPLVSLFSHQIRWMNYNDGASSARHYFVADRFCADSQQWVSLP